MPTSCSYYNSRESYTTTDIKLVDMNSPERLSSLVWKTDPGWQKSAKSYKQGWICNVSEEEATSHSRVMDELANTIDSMQIDRKTTSKADAYLAKWKNEKRPFLPISLDSPKNALSMWYGQRYKNVIFETNLCFTTWNDGGRPHEMMFTSVFSCPISGEQFTCGRYGPAKNMYIVKKEGNNNVVWYYKKQQAQHAAAARALDCLSFREGAGVRSMSFGLCKDDPYLNTENAPALPESAPLCLLESLKLLKAKVRPLPEVKVDLTDDNCEMKRAEERFEYRKSRVSMPGATMTKNTKVETDKYLLT